MLTRRKVLLAAALIAAVFPLSSGAAGTAQQPADRFIRDVGKEAIASLTGNTMSDTERQSRFRAILTRAFDMPTIARLTLGLYWRRATPDQRAEYVKLFEDFIVRSYAIRFKDYAGETLKVGQVRALNDHEEIVDSVIARPGNQPPVRVQWRVRSDKSNKIVDVIVEGISMLITQRDEFAAVIQQSNGKIDGLLADLRRKTAPARK